MIDVRVKAFLETEQGALVYEELLKMAESKNYHTVSGYSVSDPDGVSFVDKQMKYMSQYPTMNHLQYVSNLKMKTKLSK